MAVREGFLTLLLAGENYGFRLHTEWATRTTRVVNVGQSYATLDRLSRANLVESAGLGADGLEQYRVSANGRIAARAWLLGADASSADEFNETRDRCLLTLSMPAAALGELTAAEVLAGELERWHARASATAEDSGPETTAATLFARTAERERALAALRWLEELQAAWLADPHRFTVPFSTERPRRGRPAKQALAATP